MMREFGLLGLMMLAISMLSACGGENYFCDDTGCYFCDGVGCREAEPPTRNPCEGDFQCATTEVCTSIGCATSCSDGAACPSGTECKDGLCVNPTEGTTTLIPGECRTTPDCGDGAKLCVEGKCLDKGPLQACDDDDQCTHVCVDGICRTPCDSSQSERDSFRECQRVDAQFQSCQENFCRVQGE